MTWVFCGWDSLRPTFSLRGKFSNPLRHRHGIDGHKKRLDRDALSDKMIQTGTRPTYKVFFCIGDIHVTALKFIVQNAVWIDLESEIFFLPAWYSCYCNIKLNTRYFTLLEHSFWSKLNSNMNTSCSRDLEILFCSWFFSGVLWNKRPTDGDLSFRDSKLTSKSRWFSISLVFAYKQVHHRIIIIQNGRGKLHCKLNTIAINMLYIDTHHQNRT